MLDRRKGLARLRHKIPELFSQLEHWTLDSLKVPLYNENARFHKESLVNIFKEAPMSGWLKAGLICLGILVVLSLLGLIPFVALCVLPLRWVTYIVVGVLAASYMLPPRETGEAAKQGALAGIVAAAGGGLVGLVIAMIQAGTTGAMQLGDILRQLPPEAIQGLRDAGIPPEFLFGGPGGAAAGGAAAIGGAAICGSMCCFGGIIFAAILGALGAWIYASTKN